MVRDITRLDAQSYKNDLTNRTFISRRITVATTGKRTKKNKGGLLPTCLGIARRMKSFGTRCRLLNCSRMAWSTKTP